MSDLPSSVPSGDRTVSANLEDPLIRAARREALIALSVWLIAMVYSVGYCWLYGYHRSIDSLTYVLGFPDWIFWGVVVPWGACTVFSAWFCMFYMEDADLGAEPESSPAEGPSSDT